MQIFSLGLLEEHEVVTLADLDVEIQLSGCGRTGAAYLVDNGCHSLLLSFKVAIKVELSTCKIATKGSQ